MVNGWDAGVQPICAWVIYKTIRSSQLQFKVEMGDNLLWKHTKAELLILAAEPLC
jgi:hypothetical protein